MKNSLIVMLDVSRNGVMKVEQIKLFIDYISRMGYTGLELYSEDMYEVKEYPELGYLRGRYSSSELKEIDAYAISKGIELIPCIQTLAHFTNFVKTNRAEGMVDVNDILLIDEPKTYEFLDCLFKACAESFTSRNINIGMDEAHMVGLGKYLDKHGYTNRSELIIKHLTKVASIAEKYGFRCHMWSDMFIRLANQGQYYVSESSNIVIDKTIKEKIPANVSLTYWDYYKVDESHYDRNIKLHKELCDDITFAGGAHSWVGFAPCNRLTLNTMKAAIKACAKNDVSNIIVTMWGDNGKECSFFNLLPSLFAIAQYRNGNFDLDDIKAKFFEEFGLSFDDFLLLDSANFFKGATYTQFNEIINRGGVFNDLFVPVLDVAFSKWEHIDYLKAAQDIKEAGERAGEFKYLFDLQSALCEFEHYKFDLSRDLRVAYQRKDTETLRSLSSKIGAAIDKLDMFKKCFYKAYLKDNKPYGIEIHNIRFGGLTERLSYCKNVVDDYLEGKLERIDELEEALIETEDRLQVVYQAVISPSNIIHT